MPRKLAAGVYHDVPDYHNDVIRCFAQYNSPGSPRGTSVLLQPMKGYVTDWTEHRLRVTYQDIANDNTNHDVGYFFPSDRRNACFADRDRFIKALTGEKELFSRFAVVRNGRLIWNMGIEHVDGVVKRLSQISKAGSDQMLKAERSARLWYRSYTNDLQEHQDSFTAQPDHARQELDYSKDLSQVWRAVRNGQAHPALN
ncbi:uncharacterized protein F5147DRAFT_780951 [Suillus discolor]|uniref:Uncharacterized protein n=1 Tax=Suillus discolor TaxID=1912936 RepID=A0A9P7ESH9_9AGAM|nr:uncharacterized protein F5147DRAFT_780951 [Suillus discolor]KAG2088558.1 hypothetical protein F5147DRAFT_780951 [Suillus discolor]